ncbi:MAG: eukaryotic-like serine/threonine-protein kinase [Candidatus Binatota bacterium]|jgi:serine/threonine-protein kinase|nr:eukaryotic-like serine/threonine-protein kinase [Candidatus Binatota bacterium]
MVENEVSSANESTDTLANGAVLLNTYEVLDRIGAGGMGEVYRARHRQLGTLHAVKVVRRELVDSQTARSLFVEEARMLRELRHDAIVQYDGLFQDESGRVYLVMEFAEGDKLSDAIARRGALPEDEVRKLHGRLARGLAAAHARGIVHRDVSPDNIILPEGRADAAKLIDFGIASAGGDGAAGESFSGKLTFASPEQLASADVGSASDVYSLGLVLAAAATGKPLAMGATKSDAIAARRRVPRLPRAIPRRLRRELRGLLAPKAGERPSAAELVKRDLVRMQEQAAGGSRSGVLVPIVVLGIAVVVVWIWSVVAGKSPLELFDTSEPEPEIARRPTAEPAPAAPSPPIEDRVAREKPPEPEPPPESEPPPVAEVPERVEQPERRPARIVRRRQPVQEEDAEWGPIERDGAEQTR